MSFLLISAGAALAIGILALVLGATALRRSRRLAFTLRTLSGLLLICVGVLFALLAVGLQGYRALTREEVAARILVRPLAARQFEATFQFPDGTRRSFVLAGDELYVDARVLKWKPIANVMGLHTVYELDRVAGRYRDIDEERTAPRTVHSLQTERPIDLFALRQRFSHLSPLFDAAYGSGVFVPIGPPTELTLGVTTSGLIIRRSPRPTDAISPP